MNNTAAADRVYTNRDKKIKEDSYPLIYVYTESESKESGNSVPKQYRRELSVEIEFHAYQTTSSEDIDDKLADYETQIEEALIQNVTLDDLVSDFSIVESSIFVEEAKRVFGVVKVSAVAIYYTTALGVSEDALEKINTSFDQPNLDETDILEDKLEF